MCELAEGNEREQHLRETVPKIRDFMNDDDGFQRHLVELKQKLQPASFVYKRCNY
jgi:hypothetical protein